MCACVCVCMCVCACVCVCVCVCVNGRVPYRKHHLGKVINNNNNPSLFHLSSFFFLSLSPSQPFSLALLPSPQCPSPLHRR